MSRRRRFVLVAAGCVVVTLVGCASTTGAGGDPVAGQAKFNTTCVTCHSAASLVGAAPLVTNDLGTLTPAMAGITLTDQQVADIRAFLLTQ